MHVSHPHPPPSPIHHSNNCSYVILHYHCARLRTSHSSYAAARPQRLKPLATTTNTRTGRRGRPKKRRRNGGRRKKASALTSGPLSRVVLPPVSAVMRERIKNLAFVNPSPAFVPRYGPHPHPHPRPHPHHPPTSPTIQHYHPHPPGLVDNCADGGGKLLSMVCR